GYTAPRACDVCRHHHYEARAEARWGVRYLLARGRRCDDGGVMSRRAIKLAALVLLLAWLSVLIYAAVASRADTSRPNVLSLKVNGVVDPFMASYIKRGIETASHERDAAVLLTIDTPGGLDTSMRDIIRSIRVSK